MAGQMTNLKVRLPENLIKQIQGVSNDKIDKIIRDAISHYIATYASETVIAESVTQYIGSTEGMFEQNFDKLTNLIASLSYVSKFNNNILSAMFINNGGQEPDLERLYNEATDTVQKYFYFEDNDAAVLPIMEENDQLKLKVQELEKAPKAAPQAPPQAVKAQPLPEDVDASVKEAKNKVAQLQQEQQAMEAKKQELVQWINGLILYVVQNYSHFKRNEALLRKYIEDNPKPQV